MCTHSRGHILMIIIIVVKKGVTHFPVTTVARRYLPPIGLIVMLRPKSDIKFDGMCRQRRKNHKWPFFGGVCGWWENPSTHPSNDCNGTREWNQKIPVHMSYEDAIWRLERTQPVQSSKRKTRDAIWRMEWPQSAQNKRIAVKRVDAIWRLEWTQSAGS